MNNTRHIISSFVYGFGSIETSNPINAQTINCNVIIILFLSSFTAWFSFRMCMWWVRCVGFSLDKLSKQHNIVNESNNQDDRLTPPPLLFENETKG